MIGALAPPPPPAPAPALAELRPRRAAAYSAFWALLLRDLAVLRKELPLFVVRTIMQPLMLVFVFTYVAFSLGRVPGLRSDRTGAARRWVERC